MRNQVHTQHWLLYIVLGLVISSCVPNKQIIYLQHDVEPRINTITNKDSAQRKYTTRYQVYLLKPNDIISVRVATLTPSEFNFIQKYEQDLGLLRKLNQYDQVNGSGGGGQRSVGGGGGGGSTGITAGGGGASPLMLDRLQTGFVLDAEGNLELPKVGMLKLEGLTIPQAEKLVRERLTGFFETPVVRIQLLSFHFTILGEVNNEGRYTIFDPNSTVFDAISIASNLTDFADRSKIKIVRFVDEKASVFYVNALRENLLEQPGFFLQPNDLIIVPPLEAKVAKKYTIPNYTSALGLIVSTLSLVFLVVNLTR